MEVKIVEKQGNHSDKENAKDLNKCDIREGRVSVGKKREREGLIHHHYHHQGFECRKNGAVIIGNKVRRN